MRNVADNINNNNNNSVDLDSSINDARWLLGSVVFIGATVLAFGVFAAVVSG